MNVVAAFRLELDGQFAIPDKSVGNNVRGAPNAEPPPTVAVCSVSGNCVACIPDLNTIVIIIVCDIVHHRAFAFRHDKAVLFVAAYDAIFDLAALTQDNAMACVFHRLDVIDHT